jgi:hypothetical protein
MPDPPLDTFSSDTPTTPMGRDPYETSLLNAAREWWHARASADLSDPRFASLRATVQHLMDVIQS